MLFKRKRALPAPCCSTPALLTLKMCFFPAVIFDASGLIGGITNNGKSMNKGNEFDGFLAIIQLNNENLEMAQILVEYFVLWTDHKLSILMFSGPFKIKLR